MGRMNKILEDAETPMTDREFLGFVKAMTSELVDIAGERRMLSLLPGLRATMVASVSILAKVDAAKVRAKAKVSDTSG